jgi:hypothetical protein
MTRANDADLHAASRNRNGILAQRKNRHKLKRRVDRAPALDLFKNPVGSLPSFAWLPSEAWLTSLQKNADF